MDELLTVLALGGFSNEVIEDAILYEILTGTTSEEDEEDYEPFDFVNLTEEESLELFKFGKQEILRLTELLGLETVETNSCSVTGLEAICILLRRLVYPNQLADLERIFGRSRSILSSVVNTLIKTLNQRIKPALTDIRNATWVTKERLDSYGKAIHEKGAPLKNCWGFLDGNTKATPRPTRNQKEYSSAQKGHQEVKYQTIVCPDGMIPHVGGPFPGKKHDAAIFRETQLLPRLEEKVKFVDQKFVVYTDGGYPLRELIITPYHIVRSPPQKKFNTLMNSMQQYVGRRFGKALSNFGFVDLKKSERILWELVPEMYFVSVFFANCHTCLYGNQLSLYFDLQPPSLEEYVAGIFN